MNTRSVRQGRWHWSHSPDTAGSPVWGAGRESARARESESERERAREREREGGQEGAKGFGFSERIIGNTVGVRWRRADSKLHGCEGDASAIARLARALGGFKRIGRIEEDWED
jgi:hypothetical protein